MKKYYKVVKSVNGRLQSAIQDKHYLKTYYCVDEWIEPKMKGTDLFVFDSIKTAKECIRRLEWPNVVVYECEVRNPKRTGIFFNFILSKEYITRAVKKRLNKKKYRYLVDSFVPRGTIFCSAVKLVRPVG